MQGFSDILRLNSVEIIGVSDQAYLKGELVFGDIPVINDEVILEKYSNNKVSLINGIGPSPKSRRGKSSMKSLLMWVTNFQA